MSDKPNIDLLYRVMSEILSDKYNCKVTFTVTPKTLDKQEKPAKDDVA